jgi:hypothetical protein
MASMLRWVNRSSLASNAGQPSGMHSAQPVPGHGSLNRSTPRIDGTSRKYVAVCAQAFAYRSWSPTPPGPSALRQKLSKAALSAGIPK